MRAERHAQLTMEEPEKTGSPTIGVLLLDSADYDREEYRSHELHGGLAGRTPGFFGHPDTWAAPVLYRVARGCSGDESARASTKASAGMAHAARALDGRVDIITTNCAYTWYFRDAFDDVQTPVLPSGNALLEFARQIGPQTILLVSHSPTVLSLASPLSPDVRVVELEHKHEWHRFHFGLENAAQPLDVDRMAEELCDRIRTDVDSHGRPSAVVLECTGLPQFRDIVRQEYHAPVFDVVSTIHTILGLVAPRTYVKPRPHGTMPSAVRHE